MASLLGKHQIAINTASLVDGDSLAAYLTDAAGALLTSSLVGAKQSLDVLTRAEHLDGTAYVAGTNYLNSMGAVDESGNWQPVNINAAGELLVNAAVSFTAEHNEDSAAGDGFSGIATLLVRQDTLAVSTSTDGDFGAFKSNNLGELYVHDTSVLAQLVLIKSDTASIVTNTANTATNTGNIHTDLTTLTKLEDAAAASGDAGIQSLLVRQDVLASSTSTDGDYGSFKSNAAGELYVADSTVRTTLSALSKAEDAVHSSGDQGIQALAVRKDSQGTNVSTDGDYSSLLTWSEGSLKVVDIANGTILQSQVSVTDTATALPTSALANRKSLMIQNTGANKLWVGSATVTTSGATAGIELPANSFLELEVGPAVSVFAIKVGAAGNNVNLLQLA